MMIKATGKNSSNRKIAPLIGTAGTIFIISGLMKFNISSILTGLLFLMVLGYTKEVYATEEGLVTSYHYLCFKYEDKTAFDEISDIRIEASDDSTALHLIKGLTGKRIFFHNDDIGKILTMARRRNSQIVIEHLGN